MLQAIPDYKPFARRGQHRGHLEGGLGLVAPDTITYRDWSLTL